MSKDIKEQNELIARVREKFSVPMPKWSIPDKKHKASVRIYSKREKLEQARLVDWLKNDDEYLKLMAIYFGYCDILHARGYADEKDTVSRIPVADWHEKVRENFVKCLVKFIYHDMCTDPATVLGEGGSDGYWIYLDRKYLDIANMQVGDAILNLDEVWAVVSSNINDWIDKCHERESSFMENDCYRCDRCDSAIYVKDGCRFDVYENLLHCPACVRECDHWKAKRHG